jgi:hypothetical protein
MFVGHASNDFCQTKSKMRLPCLITFMMLGIVTGNGAETCFCDANPVDEDAPTEQDVVNFFEAFIKRLDSPSLIIPLDPPFV